MNKFHLFLLGTLLFAFSTHAAPPIISYSGQVAVNGSLHGYRTIQIRLCGWKRTILILESGWHQYQWFRTNRIRIRPIGNGIYSIMLGDDAISGMRTINESIFQDHNDGIYASGLAMEPMDSSNSHPTAGSPPSPTPSPVMEPTKRNLMIPRIPVAPLTSMPHNA